MELRVTLVWLGAREAALGQMWTKLSIAVELSSLAGGKGSLTAARLILAYGDGEEQVCA